MSHNFGDKFPNIIVSFQEDLVNDTVRLQSFKLKATWTTETKGAGELILSESMILPPILGMELSNVIEMKGMNIGIDDPNSLATSGEISRIMGRKLGDKVVNNSFNKMVKDIDDKISLLDNDTKIIQSILDLVIPQIPVDTGKLREAIIKSADITRIKMSTGKTMLRFIYNVPEDRPIDIIKTKDGKITVKQLLEVAALNIIQLYVSAITNSIKIKLKITA